MTWALVTIIPHLPFTSSRNPEPVCVPVLVANGRIRPISQWGYRFLRVFARDVFKDGAVAAYCAQNELYAERLLNWGLAYELNRPELLERIAQGARTLQIIQKTDV